MNKMFLRIVLTGFFILSLNTGSQAYTSPIKSDEVVIFFPTIGYPVTTETWVLHIHGWIYEPQWGGSVRQQLRRLFRHDKLDTNQSLFKERAGAFFVDNERGKKIAIRLGKKQFILSQKSASNGHFSDKLHLPAAEVETWRHGDFITFEAVTRSKDSRHFVGKIQLMDKTGVSIISDIDDTIKISEVRDKQALLANTFTRPFQAVPKMADFYKAQAQKAQAQPGNVTFHYVSASPWQLYKPLADFLTHNRFPAGSFHLRLFRWKDSSFFKFFKSSRPHKIKTIQSLITCCRFRQFILIGDSGEHDPEIYADIARQYPKQIVRIIIRDVTGENASRYQDTFKGLPKSLWIIFQDAAILF